MSTENPSFYDWCAAVWLYAYRVYGFDDAGAIEHRAEIWRQGWRAGEHPTDFAIGFFEQCDPLDECERCTGKPSQVVPFSDDEFTDTKERPSLREPHNPDQLEMF